MKKQYFSPSMKAYKVKTSAMICTSTMSYGGSNSQSGAPTVAEGKGYYDDDDWD